MDKEIIAFSEAYKTNRTILKDVLPIDIPMCLSIEPTNICNFKCVMCFQGTEKYMNIGAPFQNMTMECFNKIIEDLKNWTENTYKIKIVKLYSTGEPLVNREICEMVKKIKEANVCEKIEITTNGSLLTSDMAEKIVDYGLDYLRISVYSVKDENNKRITKSEVSPLEIWNNVKYIREYRDSKGKKLPYISAKMIDTYSEENIIFQNMYKDVADEAYIDKAMNLSTGESTTEKLYGEREAEAIKDINESRIFKNKIKACRYPFTHMTIRSDGSVVVCCSDWLLDTKYGDVNKNSLQEIWESKELYEFRKMTLLTKGKGCKACKNCELPLRDFPEDDIDDFPIKKLKYRGMEE